MSRRTTERDLWSMSGMTIAATSAAVASFSGLRGLAAAAGWPEHLAWLLPVTVDAYAMTSTRLWLAGRARHTRTRRFAAANALGAIAGSVVGNAIYHALSTGLLTVTWPIVVSVGAVPAAVLGLIAHLHALHTGVDAPEVDLPDVPEAGEQAVPEAEKRDVPAPRVGDRPGAKARTAPGRANPTRRPARRRAKHRTESELLDAARAADHRHRVKHGRPISRDALRAALKISGSRATELRRRLAASAPAAHAPDEKEVANQR
ncbi:hypothetical protein GCM10023321_79880 [Pseudonocardia eucalypti]|uniref:DUF2637 domain-containing protein n=1 Tax=Pseudonocardia eucalypti TaxID=648755 RepID=A0ABP9RC68_9PSEU|nr:hypothetical protein [Pseudonocardia eucalypti]